MAFEAPIRFAILAAPRTGSNWHCTLLDSHPEVLCHHEIFNPAGIHLARSRRGQLDLGSIEARDRDPAAILHRLWAQSFGCHAVGFKITRDQPAAVFEAVFADRSIRVVVLRRRNPLRTFVSERLAQETGRWECFKGESCHPQTPGLPRVAITAAELEAHAAMNERYYGGLTERLDAAGHAVLETTYEALPSEPERRKVLTFLGVDPSQPLQAGTVKQGCRELRDVISNFETLTSDLVGSPFAAELDNPDIRSL